MSGGAALPERTHQLFAGLGLHLAEGYGLTEASPVLTVADAGPERAAGHVGKPIPGVEIRIDDPNAEGVGEVLARGPNVMLGYSDDEARRAARHRRRRLAAHRRPRQARPPRPAHRSWAGPRT